MVGLSKMISHHESIWGKCEQVDKIYPSSISPYDQNLDSFVESYDSHVALILGILNTITSNRQHRFTSRF